MSKFLRATFLVIVVGVLASAFYFFARDDQSEDLSQATTELVETKDTSAPLVRRALGQPDGDEVVESATILLSPKDATRVEGKISIEVVGAPEEKIESGQIELRILGPNGETTRLVPFLSDGFEIFVTEDDYVLFVDALIVDGLRGLIVVEEPWFERNSILENGLHLKLKLGALRELTALDAETGETLEWAAVYRTRPTFIRDLSRQRAEPEVVASGASPLVWRDNPGSQSKPFVAAPNYVPLAVSNQEARAPLARAGRLELKIEAPWEELAEHQHLVFLEIMEIADWQWRDVRAIPRQRLVDKDQGRLTIDGIAPGVWQVTIILGRAQVLADQRVEVVASKTTKLTLNSGLESLAQPTAPRTIWLSAEADVLSTEAVNRATLTPVVNGESPSDGTRTAVSLKTHDPFEPGASAVLLDFGNLLPGVYDFRIFDDSLRLVLPVDQVGPITAALPTRSSLCLQVANRQGQHLDDSYLEVHADSRSKPVEYSRSLGGFLVPARTEEIRIFRKQDQQGQCWFEAFEMMAFKNQSSAQVLFREAYPIAINYDREMSWSSAPSLDLWDQEYLRILDSNGRELQAHYRGLKRSEWQVWVETTGPCTLTLSNKIAVPEDRQHLIQVGPNLWPEVTFRFPGQETNEDGY